MDLNKPKQINKAKVSLMSYRSSIYQANGFEWLLITLENEVIDIESLMTIWLWLDLESQRVKKKRRAGRFENRKSLSSFSFLTYSKLMYKVNVGLIIMDT